MKKTIVGYCEPWSVRAGQRVDLMASAPDQTSVSLDLVRIHCGDPTRSGPGFDEERIDSPLPDTLVLDSQTVVPGSFGEVDLTGLGAQEQLTIDFWVYPTRPNRNQVVFSIGGTDDREVRVALRDTIFFIDVDGHTIAISPTIDGHRWYRIRTTLSFGDIGQVSSEVCTIPSRSPGADLSAGFEPFKTSRDIACLGLSHLGRCYFARSNDGDFFDGRIAAPSLSLDSKNLVWDFAHDIGSSKLFETSAHERHGTLHQLPARAVTGPRWDGRFHAWSSAPEHYDAIHFHVDDVYDANWAQSASLKVPESLPSGIYAFRIATDDEVDRIPFFVRPAADAPTSDIALLMPTCTYMAYANHRMLFEGADFVSARVRLRPEHDYVRDHPELGPSMYEKHDDGSGVMFSSRRRPVMQTRPGADGWNFTPDTDINAFLKHLDVSHDILTDEDLHFEGLAALSSYRVIVTGSHPEYWSTQMLDALEQWSRDGGRLMYLGGNGFYWRVAFNDDWPGAIELRRAEDGVRNWQTETGESYHAFTGEYGGLWRRLGRAPNALVGVGFAAQGFERAVGYQRHTCSYDSRAAWIFDGVDEPVIGTSGLGGGAAGQEVDRFNIALGSPPEALILASATDFGADMTRTKEELEAAIIVPDPDPVVRADMVFFETPAGGAVFSVGSIAWFGALARNGFDNDVARITENVVRRFLDPTPFELPKKTGRERPGAKGVAG